MASQGKESKTLLGDGGGGLGGSSGCTSGLVLLHRLLKTLMDELAIHAGLAVPSALLEVGARPPGSRGW